MTVTAKKKKPSPKTRIRALRRLDPHKDRLPSEKPEVVQDSCDELDVVVDGESITVQARQRVEIKCGQAKIVLRADGAVFINGVDITTRAKKRQRISGGTVSIN